MTTKIIQKDPIIAIAGNPNSGKTALFNAMTGARQHVGNWPGVTVEKKEGSLSRMGLKARVVDLPGTYAFRSRAIDELIARDFIIDESPDVVINVADATNLERHLYLTVQMLEMGAPLIVALNMMDEAEDLGLEIDIQNLSRMLETEIVPTAAVWGAGVEDLIDTAFLKIKSPGVSGFRIDYGTTIETAISRIMEHISAEFARGRQPRWLAVKLLERDPNVLSELETLEPEEAAMLNAELNAANGRAENTASRKIPDLITEKRYELASHIAQSVLLTESAHAERPNLVDRVALHPWFAYPFFFLVIWLMFQITFTLSEPLSDAASGAVHWLGVSLKQALDGVGLPHMLTSLLADGVLGGLGAVLEFAPPIFMLFLMTSILEDIGYMARAALLSDRLMRSIGLHGKAFIPMVLGFGCNVTGILAARTLDNKRGRLIAILVNPLMSCSARLPVYILFATAFFPARRGLVVFSLYALGVLLAIGAAKVFSLLIKDDEEATFVLELPPYRLPRVSGVLIQTWERGKEFLQKAGTIILFAVVLVWFLSNLPPGTGPESPNSYMGKIGSVIAPVLRPAGFGTWQAAVTLIFGIIAKELIVGTLGILYGAGEAGLLSAIRANWTPLTAYAFLVMSLVYTPCAATLAAIRTETGSRFWAFVAAGYTLVLGWILAVIVYQGGLLLGFS